MSSHGGRIIGEGLASLLERLPHKRVGAFDNLHPRVRATSHFLPVPKIFKVVSSVRSPLMTRFSVAVKSVTSGRLNKDLVDSERVPTLKPASRTAFLDDSESHLNHMWAILQVAPTAGPETYHSATSSSSYTG